MVQTVSRVALMNYQSINYATNSTIVPYQPCSWYHQYIPLSTRWWSIPVDIIGMTPLHILCANPATTNTIVKQLYNKITEAASVRNINDMLPWHMYVIKKDTRFRMFVENDDDDDDDGCTFMTDTTRMILSNKFDADNLTEADLDIDTMEMFLILTGSSLWDWLETANTVTGLYPFMSMAKKSNCHRLCNIWRCNAEFE